MSNARRYNAVVPNNAPLPGVYLDAGPYIGIVKANIDPMRKGRISVFIEGNGGNSEDPANWRTIGYSSPFFGQTSDEGKGENNVYGQTAESYGMWFTPPDLEVRVLCTFVKGDPSNGFYFACLADAHNHHMVPGLAATDKVSAEDKAAYGADNLPVSEYNDRGVAQHQKFATNTKPAHPVLTSILKWQGLLRDKIRGITSSSSKRESPSRVFGINTPGRPVPELPYRETQNATADEAAKIKTRAAAFRMPGHSFVMDDGDTEGESNLVRMRSASGHQILMHDSEGIIYIGNSAGNAWMEFGKDGKIDVYSQSTISYHAAEDFNITAGGSVNIQSGSAMNIIAGAALYQEADGIHINGLAATNITGTSVDVFASSELKMTGSTSHLTSTGDVNLKSGPGSKVNSNVSGKGTDAVAVTALTQNTHSAIGFTGTDWQVTGELSFVATRVPQHAPHDLAVTQPVQTVGGPVGAATSTTASTAAFDAVLAASLDDTKVALSSAYGGLGGSVAAALASTSPELTGVASQLTTKLKGK